MQYRTRIWRLWLVWGLHWSVWYMTFHDKLTILLKMKFISPGRIEQQHQQAVKVIWEGTVLLDLDQPFWLKHRCHAVVGKPSVLETARIFVLSCIMKCHFTLKINCRQNYNLYTRLLSGLPVDLSKGLRPVRSSNMTTPKLYTSLFIVYWPDMSTSGARYPTLVSWHNIKCQSFDDA